MWRLTLSGASIAFVNSTVSVSYAISASRNPRKFRPGLIFQQRSQLLVPLFSGHHGRSLAVVVG